jgi:hypothetical protein
MSLVTDIQTIVTTLQPTCTFILSSKFKASRASFDIANAVFPLIILDNELSSDEEIMKNNAIQADNRIVLSFLLRDEVFNTDVQRDALVEEMKELARRTMVNIYRLPQVRIVGTGNQKYKLTPAFNVFATQLTGCIAEIRANETVMVEWCLTEIIP